MSEAPHAARIKRHQAIRIGRLGWGLVSYLVALAVNVAFYQMELLDGVHLLRGILASIVLNALFLALLLSGANLRLRDPDMTMAQISAALLPSIYAFYHVEAALARATLLILAAVVGMVYALLSLDSRRIGALAILTMGSFGVTLIAVHWDTGPLMVPPLEGLLWLGVAAVLAQLAWIGGYVSELRLSLKARNAELYELATRDPLTRLANRHALLERLGSEISRTNRRTDANRKLSLCLVDVDHFKRINDHCGHLAGDDVLRAIAEAINAALRRVDVAGRYGGEEFLVLLPDTGLEGAGEVAERLREAIRGVRLETVSAARQLTASFGVTEYIEGESLHATLRRADDALYEAKHQGRDRVVTTRAASTAGIVASAETG